MAELAADVLKRVSTADRVESRLGGLEFTDGAPSAKTVETLYDHLDYVHALNGFLTAFPAASTWAIREGFLGIGVEDNSVLIFSQLMDSSSRFLTANADTVYYLMIVDLNDGPMVVETPPMALGTFDDMWFQWIIDFGLPGPDRGAGGKFLLVPPGYDGTLPEGGFFVGHSRTNRVLMLGRSFMEDSDPAPTVATIKSTLKVYPYAQGGPGTSVGTLLQGGPLPAPPGKIPETTFVEGSGLTFNTIPPNDFGFWETVNALVQDEVVGATDPEILGHLAEIGIVKGKPFAPDDRMRGILDDAATVGNAISRALMFDARGEEDVAFYPGSAWTNMLFGGGYLFDRPIPEVTPEGHQAVPADGSPQARPSDPVLLRLHRHHTRHGHAAHRARQPVSRRLLRLEEGVLRRREVLHRDLAAEPSRSAVLVVHALRQPDPLDARHAPTVPARRKPVVPVARRGAERRRFHHRPLRARATRRRRRRQLDPDRCRARASSPSCGSTARSSRSSTRRWQVGEVEPRA